ncbi:MAG: formate acetyltransferase [Chloroflexi bacterium]|nr:formate acetyltransferase [Chloroflexota bacterium]
MQAIVRELTYQERLDALHRTKLTHTHAKQALYGALDFDDWARIPLPEDEREVERHVYPDGFVWVDVRLKRFQLEPNHPSGSVFGPRACGANFCRLLQAHPVYVDPLSSLAGGYMVDFCAYRPQHWKPELDYGHLKPDQEQYRLGGCGIGATHHFCQDASIGLELGWGGLLVKIRQYRTVNPHAAELYDGLEAVVLGTQDLVARTAAHARDLAQSEERDDLRDNLLQVAATNEWLVSNPPRTFREACQWLLWEQTLGYLYNGSAALGHFDRMLYPYYQRDTAADILDDEEAIFHIACLLLRDTGYRQLGGLDAEGRDATNRVSYLTLEAAHRLGVPSNLAVCVGEDIDPQLLHRGLEYLFMDRTGTPKFVSTDRLVEGFVRNGYPAELARLRAYGGCHWFGLPGREYSMMDMIKLNLAVVFEVALNEMLSDAAVAPSVAGLWRRFISHLDRALGVIRRSIDFQLEHMHEVLPELVLDLFCHGTIERGLDASHGGVDYYNICTDGAGLATVADSFAALEQRIEHEQQLDWPQLQHYLASDWAGEEGERVRLMMKGIERYGYGGSLADEWAVRIARTFSEHVVAERTPNGYPLIPGLFSWVGAIGMGRTVGATPNGRHAGAPISHGPCPDPGFRKDGAPSALAAAVAAVQPGYGNAAPLQLEIDPGTCSGAEALARVEELIRTHFALGGTEINVNVLDAQQLLDAHEHPERYPDLIVRVTGFSAYWSSLSREQRQIVVDRMVVEGPCH